MQTPRGCRTGCLTALLVAVVAIVLAMRSWTAPIDVPRPQRPPDPADNPYDVYRSLAMYTSPIFRTDPMLSIAERELFPSRQMVSLHRPELARYLLQQMQPVRLEYRRHLHKPCAVIMECTPAWHFPELAEFRRWANIESLDMAMAARRGDYSSAAAVRAYRLRHGFYPATLNEAGAADLNKDPFTGGGFVYKPGKQGFLMYSMGRDGKDDGGWRASERYDGRGDITLLPFYGRPVGTEESTERGKPM